VNKRGMTHGAWPAQSAYLAERDKMDYTYFPRYAPERQAVQDTIVTRLLTARPFSSVAAMAAMAAVDLPRVLMRGQLAHITDSGSPTVMYSAGIYGAGKSHVLRWLHTTGCLDLSAFVLIDPDQIKYLLPETLEYLKEDASTAASRVHMESTFIALLAEHAALARGLHMIVDGSLQNGAWYKEWFAQLRRDYPKVRIVLVQVTGVSLATAARRCEKRAQQTGRHIPMDKLQLMAPRTEESCRLLSPLVDVHIQVDNGSDDSEPTLHADSTERVTRGHDHAGHRQLE
jgi:hypothetical protein